MKYRYQNFQPLWVSISVIFKNFKYQPLLSDTHFKSILNIRMMAHEVPEFIQTNNRMLNYELRLFLVHIKLLYKGLKFS